MGLAEFLHSHFDDNVVIKLFTQNNTLYSGSAKLVPYWVLFHYGTRHVTFDKSVSFYSVLIAEK